MKAILLILAIIHLAFLTSAQQKAYFQQEVSYKIHVSLNDTAHTLSGNISISYLNNSPDSLDRIYMHLWPNAYTGDHTALGQQLLEMNELNLHLADEKRKGNITGIDFTLSNPWFPDMAGDSATVSRRNSRWEFDPKHPDIAVIYPETPVTPGQTVIISTPFHVKIPRGTISRLGHIGQSYQISQWYPKPAVYDHKGWHPMPYLTLGEFYSEFGSFDVSITLPKNYVVGATGDLQNPEELAWLEEKDHDLRESGNISTDMSFPESSAEFKTIRYVQNNVHDFAWFADKRYYVLKGEVELPHSKRKVTTWSMFTGKSGQLWLNAPEYLHDATYYYSLWLGDYPYNQVTAVDGTISAGGGMEYPNVTVIGTMGNAVSLENVIVHEVGHNWFYGILGSNERQHPWLDEGLNSFYEARYMATKYPQLTLGDFVGAGGLSRFFDLDNFRHGHYHEMMYHFSYRNNSDQPVEYPSACYSKTNYGAIVYAKTALLFQQLMGFMGEENFDRTMQSYYERWKFKHPYPEDLRQVFMEQNMVQVDWLFDTIIPGTVPVNYAVRKVKKDEDGAWLVKMKNKSSVNSPFAVSGIINDTVSVTTWYSGLNKGWIRFNAPGAEKIRIDGEHQMAEVNRKNNTIRTSGIFRKTEKLQVKFPGTIENPYRTQLFFTPAFGYNVHNGFMAGVALYNSLMPRNKFEYALVPMYSFATNRPAGVGQLNYRILPRSGLFREIQLRADAKHFSYNGDRNDYYTRIAPGVFSEFRSHERSRHRFFLNVRHFRG